MDDKQFEALEQRIAAGEALPVLEQFLHRQETQRRNAKPNALQQRSIDKAKNPLLAPRKWRRC
jgi:hypothetical protein